MFFTEILIDSIFWKFTEKGESFGKKLFDPLHPPLPQYMRYQYAPGCQVCVFLFKSLQIKLLRFQIKRFTANHKSILPPDVAMSLVAFRTKTIDIYAWLVFKKIQAT